jgi:4-azaleucine resistance transporter AzlC
MSAELSKGVFMSSPRGEFLAGVKATIPLVIGAIPFDIIFGALAITSGISPLGAAAMSVFVFAGSAQFIGVGLVAQGVATPIIVLTTLVVNLRHALYGATLAPFVKHLPQRWLLPLGYMLTDESFVIASTHYNEPGDPRYKHWYFLAANLTIFIPWQICTWIGIVAGTLIPDPARFGLDFAMSVTFIGMLVPLLKSRPVVAAVVVAGVVAVLTYTMPNKIGLMIAALAGVATGVIVEAMTGEQPALSVTPEEAA